MKIKLPPMPDKIFGIETGMITVFGPLLVTVLVAIAGLNLVVMPKFADYQIMNQSLVELRDQNKVLLDKIRYLQSVDPSELRKNADFITSALLPQKNAYLLVDVVKKIVGKYGFQIDSFLISPGKLDKEVKPTAKTTVSKIPIEVSIVGPKEAYLELLKGLEKSLPVLSLNSFKMVAQDNLVKLDLDIVAFYIQDNSQLDINKLSLSDLTLNKTETDLLSTLSSFTQTESLEDIESLGTAKTGFTKYTRTDPFSP